MPRKMQDELKASINRENDAERVDPDKANMEYICGQLQHVAQNVLEHRRALGSVLLQLMKIEQEVTAMKKERAKPWWRKLW